MTVYYGSGLDAIKKFITECVDKGGYPIFREGYIQPFDAALAGKTIGGHTLEPHIVMAVCYGAASRGGPKGLIDKLPDDLYELIIKTRGDYHAVREYLKEKGLL